MFARVTRPSRICLSRRTQTRRPRSLISTLRSPSLLSRCQSTATAQEEDEYEDSRSYPYSSHIQHYDAPSDFYAGRFRAPPLRTGTWRYGQSAALGVNSLGSPANVLILPEYDRKLPTLPEGQGTEDGTGTLQAYIDSENQPLISEKLHENIEHVRSRFGDSTKFLEPWEFKLLRKEMVKGFSTHQLRHYLQSKKPSVTAEHMRNPETTVNTILTDLWGFESTEDDVVTVDEVELRHKVKDVAKFTYLATIYQQPLKDIAQEYFVQVAVHRNKRTITISGPQESAKNALESLQRVIKEDIHSILIGLGKPLAGYTDPASRKSLDKFLQLMRDKYKLGIFKTKALITIVHHGDEAKAQQAEREIRLAGEVNVTDRHLYIWSDTSTMQPSLQPFPAPAELPWAISRLPLGRLVSGSSENKTTVDVPAARRQPDHLLIQLKQKLNQVFSTGRVFPGSKSPSDLRYEMSAYFGKALFQRAPNSKGGGVIENPLLLQALSRHSKNPEFENTKTEKALQATNAQQADSDFRGVPDVTPNLETSHLARQAKNMADDLPLASSSSVLYDPHFTGQVAYAVQDIARLRPWHEKSLKEPEEEDVTESAPPTTVRLEFSPVHSTKHSVPCLEVLMTSAAPNENGDRGPLELSKVTAIHDEKAFHLLLPEQTVDIKLTRQIKHDLYFDGCEINDVHQPIIDDIKEYLGLVQSPESVDWIFAPFLKLSIHSSMRNVASRAATAALNGRMYKEGKPKELKNGEIPTIEYMLRSVGVLDVDTRSLQAVAPSGTDVNLAIDYMTYSGTTATHHDFRLGERPYMSPSGSPQMKISDLLDVAMQLASLLGRPSATENPEPMRLTAPRRTVASRRSERPGKGSNSSRKAVVKREKP